MPLPEGTMIDGDLSNWSVPMILKRMGKGAAILLILAFLGCATTGKATHALLARDDTTMTNAQLQTYFRQLNDQIANEEREASGGGFRLGSAKPENAPLPPRVKVLQTRRNRVWAELRKRGLMP